jgi:hypothetical protein
LLVLLFVFVQFFFLLLIYDFFFVVLFSSKKTTGLEEWQSNFEMYRSNCEVNGLLDFPLSASLSKNTKKDKHNLNQNNENNENDSETDEEEEENESNGFEDETFLSIMKHDVILGLMDVSLLPRLRLTNKEQTK